MNAAVSKYNLLQLKMQELTLLSLMGCKLESLQWNLQ